MRQIDEVRREYHTESHTESHSLREAPPRTPFPADQRLGLGSTRGVAVRSSRPTSTHESRRDEPAGCETATPSTATAREGSSVSGVLGVP